MISFFRLIRSGNLLIIAATMYLLRYMVMRTWLDTTLSEWGLTLQLSHFDFFLLVLSVVMIAAAGYIVNDYFDEPIDLINHPEDTIINKGIARNTAFLIHAIFNVIGIGLGFYVAWKIGYFRLGFVHAICAAGLWFYSSTFKKQMLMGNIIVAVMAALVPILTGLFEFPLLIQKFNSITAEYQQVFEQNKELQNQIAQNLNGLMKFILVAALLSFLLTFIREIIKDVEDLEGDSIYGCRTLVVVAGIKITKIVIISLTILTMSILGYIMFLQASGNYWYSLTYFLLFFQIPLAVVVYLTGRATHKKQFNRLGKLLKVIMLLGLFYTIVYNYLLKQGI